MNILYKMSRHGVIKTGTSADVDYGRECRKFFVLNIQSEELFNFHFLFKTFYILMTNGVQSFVYDLHYQ